MGGVEIIKKKEEIKICSHCGTREGTNDNCSACSSQKKSERWKLTAQKASGNANIILPD